MLRFQTLWRNHPLNVSERYPCRMAGLPTYRNQCAIRTSVALKAAGLTYAQMPRGMAMCRAHPKEEMHYIRAEELGKALNMLNIAGLPKAEILRNPKTYYHDLFGRTGIVLFRNYWFRKGEKKFPTGDHIDLWNGSRTSSGWLMSWFFWAGYYGGYEKSSEIWFWEVK